MKLIKITRTEEFVRIKFQSDGKLASQLCDITYHEAPLKEFDDALQALGPVCGNWLGAGADYGKDVIVRGVSLSYTKAGTKSAEISFKKPLDIVDTNLTITTPCVQIDEPYANEETRRECSKKQAELIYEVMAKAEAYIKGDRQQLILPLAEAAEPEDGEGTQVDFPAEGKKRAHG